MASFSARAFPMAQAQTQAPGSRLGPRITVSGRLGLISTVLHMASGLLVQSASVGFLWSAAVLTKRCELESPGSFFAVPILTRAL